MVVLHFSIHQAKKILHTKIDILSREDATEAEVHCAKNLETFFLETFKWVAEEKNFEIKVTKVRPKSQIIEIKKNNRAGECTATK